MAVFIDQLDVDAAQYLSAIALQLAGNFSCGDQRQFDNDGHAGTRGHDDAGGGGLYKGIGQAGCINSDEDWLIGLQAIQYGPALRIGGRSPPRRSGGQFYFLLDRFARLADTVGIFVLKHHRKGLPR